MSASSEAKGSDLSVVGAAIRGFVCCMTTVKAASFKVLQENCHQYLGHHFPVLPEPVRHRIQGSLRRRRRTVHEKDIIRFAT